MIIDHLLLHQKILKNVIDQNIVYMFLNDVNLMQNELKKNVDVTIIKEQVS